MRRLTTAIFVAFLALVPGAALGQGLPPGHPPMPEGEGDDDGEGDEMAPPNPHGNNPHGGSPRAEGQPRFFEPPPDGSQEDTALPVGTIVVMLRDAQDKPIAGAEIALSAIFNTVAKGEAPEKITRRVVGEDGTTRFDGLTVGSGTTYSVGAARGAAKFSVPRFPLNDKAGKRVFLHVYDSTSNIEQIHAGAQAVVYLALKEDAIQVEQLFIYYNLDPVAWVPDERFDLPKGFKAFNKQEAQSGARVEEVSGAGAALRGTFTPGRHDLDFRYQVPLDELSAQSITIEMPPHVAQVRVMAESSKSMVLDVAGFPPPEKTSRDGKRLLVTEKQTPRMDGGVKELVITLSGLPTPGAGRWIAVLLAVGALTAGIGYFAQRREDGTLDEDERADLLEAKEALLAEIVTLERAHRSGEIGPKTYARLRGALLDALARIVERLDRAREARAAARKRRQPTEETV